MSSRGNGNAHKTTAKTKRKRTSSSSSTSSSLTLKHFFTAAPNAITKKSSLISSSSSVGKEKKKPSQCIPPNPTTKKDYIKRPIPPLEQTADINVNDDQDQFDNVTLSSLFAKRSKSKTTIRNNMNSNNHRHKRKNTTNLQNDAGIQSFFSTSFTTAKQVLAKTTQKENVITPPHPEKKENVEKSSKTQHNISELISNFTKDIQSRSDDTNENNSTAKDDIVDTESESETEPNAFPDIHKKNTLSQNGQTKISSFPTRPPHKKLSNNILHALFERSTTLHHRRKRLLQKFTTPLEEHVLFAPITVSNSRPSNIHDQIRHTCLNVTKHSPTVQFATSSEQSNHVSIQSRRRGQITSLELDSKGILMAASCSRGSILVFDFDELHAMDMQCRNQACRDAAQRELDTIALNETKESSSPSNNHAVHETSSSTPELHSDAPSTHANESDKPSSPSKKDKDSEDPDSSSPPVPLDLIYKTQYIKPLIALHTNKYISSVKWNPDNEDQIAVSFMCHHEVKLFDLGASNPTSAALSLTNSNISRENCEGNSSLLFLSMKPQMTHCPSNTLKTRRNTRLLVGSYCGTIRMWTLCNIITVTGKRKKGPPKLIWSVHPFSSQNASSGVGSGGGGAGGRGGKGAGSREAVTDMVLLGRDYRHVTDMNQCHQVTSQYTGMLLVGGSLGTLALVDMVRCTRKAFSTHHTPTILRRYRMSNMLQPFQRTLSIIPPESTLGVKKLCVWNPPLSEEHDISSSSSSSSSTSSSSSSLEASSREARMRLADQILRLSSITAILNCGWVAKFCFGFESIITKTSTSMGLITALHTTQRVLFLDKDVNNNYAHKEKLTWSLPELACPGWAMSNSSLLCIGQVPQQMDVLPDKDNRVCVSEVSRELEQKRENAFLIMDGNGTGGTEMAMKMFQKVKIKGTPSAIIVHPSEEWIIVGFSEFGELALFSTRE